MPSISLARTVARAIATGLARGPAGSWIAQRGALAPVVLKGDLLRRMMTAIASRAPVSTPLVETNLGIASDLRCLVPSAKYGLLYGKPSHHVSERATLALAAILARHSPAFIDIGAHEGLFTFTISAALGPRHHHTIHCFEPDAEVFERLATNLERNGIRARANHAAVSDHVGMQTFHRNLTDDSSGSLTSHFAGKHATVAVETKVTSLAHYFLSHGIEKACVKVDVEGAGVGVWEGARAGFDRIRWLIIEIIGPEVEAALPRRIIRESGWHAYYIRDYGLVPSVAGEFEYRAPFHNWLFCAESPALLAGMLKDSRLRITDPTAGRSCA